MGCVCTEPGHIACVGRGSTVGMPACAYRWNGSACCAHVSWSCQALLWELAPWRTGYFGHLCAAVVTHHSLNSNSHLGFRQSTNLSNGATVLDSSICFMPSMVKRKKGDLQSCAKMPQAPHLASCMLGATPLHHPMHNPTFKVLLSPAFHLQEAACRHPQHTLQQSCADLAAAYIRPTRTSQPSSKAQEP